MNEMRCAFCKERRRYVYQLNGYAILQCTGCGLIGVGKPPCENDLFEYYQGFSFQAELANLNLILTPSIRSWFRSFVPTIPSKMLDFGGGGGFFAKAFEHFGFGESTYADIDGKACRFARTKLGLQRVLHCSADEFPQAPADTAFDFIYCRHVIEHLLYPERLIGKLADWLSPKGVLIVQCPNGRSKEGIAYPGYWKKFLAPAARDNHWSVPYALAFSLSKRYGWGISPPRHLWAITGRSIASLFPPTNPSFSCVLKSASLANPVYSPYFVAHTRLEKLRNLICDRVFGTILPGMHLIAEIHRK